MKTKKKINKSASKKSTSNICTYTSSEVEQILKEFVDNLVKREKAPK